LEERFWRSILPRGALQHALTGVCAPHSPTHSCRGALQHALTGVCAPHSPTHSCSIFRCLCRRARARVFARVGGSGCILPRGALQHALTGVCAPHSPTHSCRGALQHALTGVCAPHSPTHSCRGRYLSCARAPPPLAPVPAPCPLARLRGRSPKNV